MSIKDFQIKSQIEELLEAVPETEAAEKKSNVKTLIEKQIEKHLLRILDESSVSSFEAFTEEEYVRHKIKTLLEGVRLPDLSVLGSQERTKR
jgi:hypothetical protein